MKQIFFSYAREDQAVAQSMIDAMSRAGYSIWNPEMLSLRDDFIEQEIRAIEAAQCLVVLWSTAAARSDFMQREIRQIMRAWSSNRLVLTVLDDAALSVGLRDLSHIRFHDADSL